MRVRPPTRIVLFYYGEIIPHRRTHNNKGTVLGHGVLAQGTRRLYRVIREIRQWKVCTFSRKAKFCRVLKTRSSTLYCIREMTGSHVDVSYLGGRCGWLPTS